MRSHVILSVFKRNFLSYFSSVLGYLFIGVFVVGGALLAFSPRFFAANEPSLDQLNEWFPTLLLFIIPAITMSVWADEKKQGTDELLFTLPATYSEILLGKYLSVLAVYSVALLFSLTHVVVLSLLGNPDLSLLTATYVGYFFAGAALLAAGMFASSLTSSPTVAFILGVVICGIPVYIGQSDGLVAGILEVLNNAELTSLAGAFDRLFGWTITKADFFGGLSVSEQFSDFGRGQIPLAGCAYFIAFTLFMLYLNYVVITRRHWAANKTTMGMQYLVRAVAIAAILVSACYMFGKTAVQADMTSERLFSLSDSTAKIVDGVEKERPITIQAFVSSEVPRDYVAVKKRLMGLLSRYDRMGGSRITVREVLVEPFSKEADEARHFGIRPQRVMDNRDGRVTQQEVFLGAVVTSSYDEVVVPFFGNNLPVEYELTRCIQTAAKAKRLKVGVLRTDAQMLSGANEWQIVTELKKQYDVEEVVPTSEIDKDKYDVLIAVMPSALTDPEMANLVKYVQLGRATLIFDDPCPMMFSGQFGLSSAPRLPKPRQGGGMMGMQQPPPAQKHANGKATDLIDELDIVWDNGRTVFEMVNPHPQFAGLPQEYVFLTPSANSDAFNKDSAVTSGLQEVVAIYSGTVQHRKRNSKLTFKPLLVTSGKSGLLPWEEYTSNGFNPFNMSQSVQLKPSPFRVLDDSAHALAAHITSDEDGSERNVIFVADIDMISDIFFQLRASSPGPDNPMPEFDNVTFVLNAVDVLAKEESFIALRKRRAKSRTLTTIDRESEQFDKARMEEEKNADEEVKVALEKAKSTFAARRKEIEEDATLGQSAQSRLLQQVQQTEQRKLDVLEANLENSKNARIQKAKVKASRQRRAIQSKYKWAATLLPALLPIFFGMLFLGIRGLGERSSVTSARKR